MQMEAQCVYVTIHLMKQTEALTILKTGRNVYLTGAAGSGKTYVLNEYISYLKNRGIAVGVTASTGIAATHLGGVTIHSWSGAGIKDTLRDEEIEALTEKEYLHKRLDKARVLVIDEVSMLSPRLLDTVERICRVMKRNDKPFGGMQVVLSGDFFQLPPVARGVSDIEFINVSDTWRNMDVRVCYLKEQFRHDDRALEDILNEMRTGMISTATKKIFADICKQKRGDTIVPTRLYTHNVDVDAENERELAELPGEDHIYEMTTKGKTRLVESLVKSILAPAELHLKKNAVVMFVKNNFEEGYVNGTLGIVKGFDKSDMPIVETRSGKTIYVSAVEWEVEEDGKVLARVEQLPIRLAWAITIHKSQGMSMDAAEIDLSKAFVPGQGYVALSRLRTLAGLTLAGINDVALSVHPNVLSIDRQLQKESEKWRNAVAQFSEEKIYDMHTAFVDACGGTTDEKEIAKNKAEAEEKKDASSERVPTHEKTKVFVEKKMSIKEIARERGITQGTILSHIEKLHEKDPKIYLDMYKPGEKDLRVIRAAFRKSGDMKLAPVYNILGGRYTYDELRLARLFVG